MRGTAVGDATGHALASERGIDPFLEIEIVADDGDTDERGAPAQRNRMRRRHGRLRPARESLHVVSPFVDRFVETPTDRGRP
jgi:hypothetical protein